MLARVSCRHEFSIVTYPLLKKSLMENFIFCASKCNQRSKQLIYCFPEPLSSFCEISVLVGLVFRLSFHFNSFPLSNCQKTQKNRFFRVRRKQMFYQVCKPCLRLSKVSAAFNHRKGIQDIVEENTFNLSV